MVVAPHFLGPRNTLVYGCRNITLHWRAYSLLRTGGARGKLFSAASTILVRTGSNRWRRLAFLRERVDVFREQGYSLDPGEILVRGGDRHLCSVANGERTVPVKYLYERTR